MPVNWRPKTTRIEQLIQEEDTHIKRLEEERLQVPSELALESTLPFEIARPANKPLWNVPQPFSPQGPTLLSGQRETQPVSRPQYPSIPAKQPVAQAPQLPIAPLSTTQVAEKPLVEVVPFWQRALQYFGAPFDWVDENIIKPGLGTIGTQVGLENVARLPGEDFWEWKKRSWEQWDSPGVDIDVPWMAKPWRVDVKGIAQLAPWLLIPGVGHVGKGVKGLQGAVGIAGWLGKRGVGGRVLGTTLQYSPWGLVERVTVAVAKGTIGLALKTGQKATVATEAKLFGKLPVKVIEPEVKKFTQFIDDVVKPRLKAFEQAKPALRARQAGGPSAVWKAYREGKLTWQEATAQAQAARAGGIKAGFAVPAGQISSDEIKVLIDKLVRAGERGDIQIHQETNAIVSLTELLTQGTLPEPAIIRDWAKVFGDDFAKSVMELKGVKASTLEKIWDIANIPRTVLASFDASGIGRQGLILGLSHPTLVPKSLGRMVKVLFSEKLAQNIDDAMRAEPVFREFLDFGGYAAPLSRTASAITREESYISKIAEALPFIRRSERAFITYLNSLRFNAFKAGRDAMLAQGAKEADLRSLARFINLSSGRGDLPFALERFAPVMAAFLFSPRTQLSRLQLPRQLGRMLLSGNPYLRKEAAVALTTFLGGGTALLGILNATGAAKVESDPRSGDFGKIRFREGTNPNGTPKYSETRLDIWTGYIQYARFVSQFVAGQKKSAYGYLNKAERYDLAYRFLQGKFAPAFGLMVDLLKGENYKGEPLFEGTQGILRMSKERLVPLALQDIIDAMEQGGINNAWTAVPASLGFGTLTYINDFVRVKEKIANDLGYNSWDELDPKTQQEMFNTNIDLQVAQLKFDRQSMGTAWGDWRIAGNAIEDSFRENVDLAVAQYRATGDGVQFREKIADTFMKRKGAYAAREKDARFVEIVTRQKTQDPAESLINLGHEQLAIRTYNEALYGDDMYDEFGDYRFEEVDQRKLQLMQKLGDELYQYVEEYQGIKDALLPPEYHELVEAKKILKPYWEVRDRVAKLFGARFADSPKGQALISKIRKGKRLSSPTMNEAYQKFYARQQ